jgi:hypothetical protein
LTYSNQFDPNWQGNNAVAILGYADRNGGTNAWLLREQGSLIQHYIRQSSGLYSGIGTFSFYAKKKDYDWIQFGRSGDGGDYANFNISNGTLGNVSGASIIDRKIDSVGNGWYRCSVTYIFGSNSFVGIALIRSDVSSRYEVYQGDNTSGTYIQDAQVEQGLVATDYIETGASTAQAGILEDMPRLDYSGSCPSLLLEPQRTNLVTNSEYYSASSWQNVGVTIIENNTTSPDGFENASKIEATSGGGSARFQDYFGALTGTHTFSIFIKSTGVATRVNLQTNDVGGATFSVPVSGSPTLYAQGTNVGDPFIEDYGSGWYRVGFAFNPTGGGVNNYFQFYPDSEGSYRSIFAFGAQAESGSYPTSYIPTYGSSVTRSADNPIISSAGDIVDINQGTLFIDVTIDSNVNTEIYLMKFDGVNFNDTLYLYRTAIGKIQGVYRIGGSAYKEETTGAISGRLKAAFAYDSNNDCTLYVNGSKIGSSFSIPTPSVNLTAMRLGGFNDTLAKQSGGTHQSLYFPTALTDSECIALTTI